MTDHHARLAPLRAAVHAAILSARESCARARWRLEGASTETAKRRADVLREQSALTEARETERDAAIENAPACVRLRQDAEARAAAAERQLHAAQESENRAAADLRACEAELARAIDAAIDAQARDLMRQAQEHLTALEALTAELRTYVPDAASETVPGPACLPELLHLLERLPKEHHDDLTTPIDVLRGLRRRPSKLAEMRAALLADEVPCTEEQAA